MGRHSAQDDSTVHPLVAAALADRSAAPRVRAGDRTSDEGGPGWPGPPARRDGSVGWPGETGPDQGAGRREETPGSPEPGSGHAGHRSAGASPAA